MKNKPLISLCIPTNGVSEWVFPVLESIYSQDVDNSLFEVIITDNGHNDEFKNSIKAYCKSRDNIVYVELDALPFINEIESYKRANGTLIKFVNHRTRLIPGTLLKLVEFASENSEDKPIIYFANGVLKIKKQQHKYKTFDEFVRNLSLYSSWSTGMSIWKEDFEKLPTDVRSYNELFPHMEVLFHERNRGAYVIDNSIIFDELPQGKKPKGSYDLFYAFGVEYPWIICNLLRDKSISPETYRIVTSDNLDFIARLYFRYIVRKAYCSYDLKGLEGIYDVFYSKRELMSRVRKQAFNSVIMKLKGNARNVR